MLVDIEQSNLKPENKEALLVGIQKQEVFFGPIPSPRTLGGYEEVLPGSANRILTMAETQASHDQRIEDTDANNRTKVIDGQLNSLDRQMKIQEKWQYFFMTITVLLFVLAAVLILRDKDIAGLVAFITAITALISSAFIKFFSKSSTTDSVDSSESVENE